MRKEITGETDRSVAITYDNIGVVYKEKSQLDTAMYYFKKAENIKRKLYDEDSDDIAISYNYYADICSKKSEYRKALNYYYKILEIRQKIYAENSAPIAETYNNLGVIYETLSEIDKALEYHEKSLAIRKKIFGDMHEKTATSYNNIGTVYFDKNELDKALEYFTIALDIRKQIFGEKNIDVATSYGSVGTMYNCKKEYFKSFEYHEKSLQILSDLVGENSIDVARCYLNLGNNYSDMTNKVEALVYYKKSNAIIRNLLGENTADLALGYNNIAFVYRETEKYDSAMIYFQKCLNIRKMIYGKKHFEISSVYNNMGDVYFYQNMFFEALKYYQKAQCSNLRNYNDSVNFYNNPKISDYLEATELMKCYSNKAWSFYYIAEDFENTDKNLTSGKSKTDFYKLALQNYFSCDTIISIARKNSGKESDKIFIGEKSSDIYEKSIEICLKLAQINSGSKNANQPDYKELAFYFSEKNKTGVLLEALAGSEAQKFAGIPQDLLYKEHQLNIDIAFFEKQATESTEQSKQTSIRDTLFKLNRLYDKLIAEFELNYPDYYNLKYAKKDATLKQIQKILDDKTLLRSYTVGDSSIYIFNISNKTLDIQKTPFSETLYDKIEILRTSLTENQDKAQSKRNYLESSYFIYNQLFPDSLDIKKYENFIIIPDGALSIIPFEALTNQKYTNSEVPLIKDFGKLPFLIKKYSISYSYSVNLFFRTFEKEKQKTVEVENINDWLALAPVFTDENSSGTSIASRSLLPKMQKTSGGKTITRGTLLNGDYINPLPASEDEVTQIFNIFNDNGEKAMVKTHNQASEKFVKSGELSKYRILHIATHGFVNPESPELSGILLAQDSTSDEDGILFSGEIYNLKFNSDLIVLSACETGLGKIKKGEGIIGLTRALLYAGTKNIMVSLWQVSDQSTSELMIEFYKNVVEKSAGFSKSPEFADPLRKAKLKMIEEGTFSHPFFWSPFILIGR